MKYIIYLLLIAVVAFVAQVGMAPLAKFHELQLASEANQGYHALEDTLLNAPELLSLVRESAYKESLLQLATGDSIGLIVNLRDSTVLLCLKGVIIHTSNVKIISVDPLLKKLPIATYVTLFSKPMGAESERSTIVKEPIVVRQAPKDTLEAARNANSPDAVIQNPAFFEMQLENGIRIIFNQEEPNTLTEQWAGMLFKVEAWIGNSGSQVYNFLTFSPQEYYPKVRVDLTANDLRSIYRALPKKACVTVSY